MLQRLSQLPIADDDGDLCSCCKKLSAATPEPAACKTLKGITSSAAAARSSQRLRLSLLLAKP